MNPAGYPTDNVQLQGRNYGYPGPAGGPTVSPVQYTTVNVISEAPKDHVVWSICSFIHLNPCCLGLAALIFSIKARDRKVAGDMAGARHYGSTARRLNICAMVLASIMILIILITVILGLEQVNTLHNAFIHEIPYGDNYRG